MNFYQLSTKLKIGVEIVFKKHQELFPDVKVFDYTVGLTEKEIEKLTFNLTK
jgi:hypothetical protein